MTPIGVIPQAERQARELIGLEPDVAAQVAKVSKILGSAAPQIEMQTNPIRQ